MMTTTAIVGRKSCGCAVAIDFEDTQDRREAYRKNGYTLEIVTRERGREILLAIEYPCKHSELIFSSVLFLDVDGVLNSYNTRGRDPAFGFPLSHLDVDKVELLNQIVERTGCGIVLSSSWRNLYTLDTFINLLLVRGFKYPRSFVGVTRKSSSEAGECRGKEIGDWLAGNLNTAKFVIVDDDDDMGELKDDLVQTSSAHGLLPQHVNDIVFRLTST